MSLQIVDTQRGFLFAWEAWEARGGFIATASVHVGTAGQPGEEVHKVQVGPCASHSAARLLVLGECQWRLDNGLAARGTSATGSR
jgi:hypothetical protein